MLPQEQPLFTGVTAFSPASALSQDAHSDAQMQLTIRCHAESDRKCVDQSDPLVRIRPEFQTGIDISRVIVRRTARFTLIQVHHDVGRDGLSFIPLGAARRFVHRAVAGEGKLAPCRPGRALIDHITNRVRIAVVINAVHDHFSNAELTRKLFAAGFVINRRRQDILSGAAFPQHRSALALRA